MSIIETGVTDLLEEEPVLNTGLTNPFSTSTPILQNVGSTSIITPFESAPVIVSPMRNLLVADTMSVLESQTKYFPPYLLVM